MTKPPAAPRRAASVRQRLLWLTAGALLPLALAAGLALQALLDQQLQQTEQSSLDLTRALATAVDAELRLTVSALQTLEEKGYVRHEAEGRAYRYFATVEAERAGGSALARIRDAIFHGSAERMFAQLVSDRGLGREELERMRALLAERLGDE